VTTEVSLLYIISIQNNLGYDSQYQNIPKSFKKYLLLLDKIVPKEEIFKDNTKGNRVAPIETLGGQDNMIRKQNNEEEEEKQSNLSTFEKFYICS